MCHRRFGKTVFAINKLIKTACLKQSKGYVYSHHVAPHDIEVRELGSGKSRKEQAQALGLYFTVAPKLPINHGIDAT